METNSYIEPVYLISAVAEILSIHPQTLRQYEREGLIKPSRTNGKIRLYTQKDIETIKSIYHLLKEKGFTIEGAKKELDTQKNQAKEQSAIIKKLKDLRKNILNLRTELDNN